MTLFVLLAVPPVPRIIAMVPRALNSELGSSVVVLLVPVDPTCVPSNCSIRLPPASCRWEANCAICPCNWPMELSRPSWVWYIVFPIEPLEP